MDAYDQIFAGLPPATRQRILSDVARGRYGSAEGLFETAEQFNTGDVPPLDFLIDGLLARGQLVVLGGRAKSGKSWLAAQMAQALDTGRSFLGRATQKSRVLYLPLEDKRARLKRRAEMLGWRPQTTMFRYNIGHFNGPNNTFGPGLTLIDHAAHDFDAILIDTLIATLDGNISENDNTSMGAIANELKEISSGLGCAIILVHHTGKGMSDDIFNLLRGASSLRGAYDVGLLMDRRQGEREAVLHVESRDFNTNGLTIRQRDDGGGWDLVGEAKERDRIRAGRRVIEAISDLGDEVTVDELCEYMDISRQSISQQLNLAERDGKVVRRSSPITGKEKGRPKDLWSLAGSESENVPVKQATLPGERGAPQGGIL